MFLPSVTTISSNLFVHRCLAVIQILVFGKTFLLLGFNRLVSECTARLAPESDPNSDDKLPDQHANGASRNAEDNANDDGEQHEREELFAGSSEGVNPTGMMGDIVSRVVSRPIGRL